MNWNLHHWLLTKFHGYSGKTSWSKIFVQSFHYIDLEKNVIVKSSLFTLANYALIKKNIITYSESYYKTVADDRSAISNSIGMTVVLHELWRAMTCKEQE